MSASASEVVRMTVGMRLQVLVLLDLGQDLAAVHLAAG